MQLFEHPDCNLLLEAGGRPDVVDLPAWRGERITHSGLRVHVVESFWKPTPEEIADLVAGHCIVLCCVGPSAPPVMLMTRTCERTEE